MIDQLLDTDSSSPICETVVVWCWFRYYDTLQLIVWFAYDVMSLQLDSRDVTTYNNSNT